MRKEPSTAEQPSEDRTVRPRLVWAGVTVALIGTALAALGVASWSAAPVTAGIVVTLLGTVLALRSGIHYDVHGVRPARAEIFEVRRGRVHQGTAPGDMVVEPQVRREAVAASQTAGLARAAREAAERPGLVRAGAALLVAGACFVLCAQGLYAHTHLGQHNATRDLGVAILVALTGLRLLVGIRPARTWSLVAVGGGLLLLACALLVPHDRTAAAAVESTAGAWMAIAGFLTLDRTSSAGPLGAHPRGQRR